TRGPTFTGETAQARPLRRSTVYKCYCLCTRVYYSGSAATRPSAPEEPPFYVTVRPTDRASAGRVRVHPRQNTWTRIRAYGGGNCRPLRDQLPQRRDGPPEGPGEKGPDPPRTQHVAGHPAPRRADRRKGPAAGRANRCRRAARSDRAERAR